jgi:peroxisomal enoyl-CoA hydratase 2
MVDFKSPEAFADPDDPKLVADAKRDVASPTEYSYTEASTINTVERWD